MRIEIYLDDAQHPFQTITPPEKFKLQTEAIADGEHQLRFKTIDSDGSVSQRIVTFKVHNGPAIAVHGISEGDTLSGNIDVLVNAYGSHIGDEFEPERIETPAPVPTWAWVLVLVVIAWGAGYLATALTTELGTSLSVSGTNASSVVETSGASAGDASLVLGEQVYGNNCSSCHQQSGEGLPGVFPPLRGNPAVLAEDATDHITAVIAGVANKVIDGVSYAAPMPPFSALSDEEVAAVVNHERRSWGNNAVIVSAEDVAALR